MRDLRRLQHFVTLAETLSFTKAAKRLNIAQPALSVSIRRLEGEVGAELFVRTTRGVRLTPSGETVLAAARRTLFHAAEVKNAARLAAEGSGGTLRVGFIVSATFGLLQRTIPAFLASYPGVELVLREANSSRTVATWLQDDEIDIGIVRGPLIEAYSAKLLELESDYLIAALPSSHPAAAMPSLELRDLANEKFVMYRQTEASGMRSAALLACQQAGFFPKIVQEALQIHTVLALVESGLGVGLVPSVVRGFTSERIAYRTLRNPPEAARVAYSVIYDDEREIPAARLFRESLLQTLKVETHKLGAAMRNTAT